MGRDGGTWCGSVRVSSAGTGACPSSLRPFLAALSLSLSLLLLLLLLMFNSFVAERDAVEVTSK